MKPATSGPMRFRKLRIAFSVACGIACLLLIVLWVRSYSQADMLRGPVSQSRQIGFSSALGVLLLQWRHDPSAREAIRGWRLQHISMVKMEQLRARAKARGAPMLGAVKKWGLSDHAVRTPHWFPVVLSGALGAAPWLRWRFSLRSLLIAMTVAAVLLGLIVCALRWSAG
jgi:hypothetical protein